MEIHILKMSVYRDKISFTNEKIRSEEYRFIYCY